MWLPCSQLPQPCVATAHTLRLGSSTGLAWLQPPAAGAGAEQQRGQSQASVARSNLRWQQQQIGGVKRCRLSEPGGLAANRCRCRSGWEGGAEQEQEAAAAPHLCTSLVSSPAKPATTHSASPVDTKPGPPRPCSQQQQAVVSRQGRRRDAPHSATRVSVHAPLACPGGLRAAACPAAQRSAPGWRRWRAAGASGWRRGRTPRGR